MNRTLASISLMPWFLLKTCSYWSQPDWSIGKISTHENRPARWNIGISNWSALLIDNRGVSLRNNILPHKANIIRADCPKSLSLYTPSIYFLCTSNCQKHPDRYYYFIYSFHAIKFLIIYIWKNLSSTENIDRLPFKHVSTSPRKEYSRNWNRWKTLS